MSDRIVYVKRTGKYERIEFEELKINESFILCESDGTPVGHYVAASNVYEFDSVNAVSVLEVKQ